MLEESSGRLFEDDSFLENSKTCRICLKTKHKSEFPKHIAHKDKLDTRCRMCHKVISRESRERRKRAGMPPDKCECCGAKTPRSKMRCDHDHITGKDRGWLCDKCNVSIGHLGDSIEGITNALNYLKSKMKLDISQP